MVLATSRRSFVCQRMPPAAASAPPVAPFQSTAVSSGQPAKRTSEFGKAGLNLSRPRPITSEHKRVGDGRAGLWKRRDLPIPRARWRAGPGRCRERADARPGRAIPPVISVAVGSKGHSGICIHRAVMMSPVRGQSGRSGESEDSKTNKNGSGHSRSSSAYPPQEHAQKSLFSTTRHSSDHTFLRVHGGGNRQLRRP
jgi:hypothetical protein